MHLANSPPKKAIAHYKALNPIILIDVYYGNLKAIRLAANFMHTS